MKSPIGLWLHKGTPNPRRWLFRTRVRIELIRGRLGHPHPPMRASVMSEGLGGIGASLQQLKSATTVID